MQIKPPLPPFTEDSVRRKERTAEDGWSPKFCRRLPDEAGGIFD